MICDLPIKSFLVHPGCLCENVVFLIINIDQCSFMCFCVVLQWTMNCIFENNWIILLAPENLIFIALFLFLVRTLLSLHICLDELEFYIISPWKFQKISFFITSPGIFCFITVMLFPKCLSPDIVNHCIYVWTRILYN